MGVPNLFIIGAPKAGTTALANNLSLHPEIFVPDNKEPRFFDASFYYDYEDDYPIRSMKEYLEIYKVKGAEECRYRIDASVFIMYQIDSIRKILELSPEAKFIIILREPVSASVSMYKQRMKYSELAMREVSDDFIECWSLMSARRVGQGLPRGCRNKNLFRYDFLYSYEEFIPEILDEIPSGNVKVLFYEDFVSEPELLYKDIFDFLKLEGVVVQNKRLNESFLVRRSWLLILIEKFAVATLPIRSRLGLELSFLRGCKEKIIKLYRYKNSFADVDLSAVDSYFEKTNKFLAGIRKKN